MAVNQAPACGPALVGIHGTPHAGDPSRNGAVLHVAEHRKRSTELAEGGAQSLCVLRCGNWWTLESLNHVACAAPGRAALLPGPTAVRGPARADWARRWWSVLSTAVQQAIGHTALGRARAVPGPAQSQGPALDEVLALAPADPVSRHAALTDRPQHGTV